MVPPKLRGKSPRRSHPFTRETPPLVAAGLRGGLPTIPWAQAALQRTLSCGPPLCGAGTAGFFPSQPIAYIQQYRPKSAFCQAAQTRAFFGLYTAVQVRAF